MATTVTRSNYWMLKLTSDTSPAYNFKFVVDIWVDGAKFIRLKQPKNNNDSAHINFEKIVKNYIKVTNKHDNTIGSLAVAYDSLHLIPLSKTDWSAREDYALSKNTDTLKTFTFKFYEEYSDTADGTVSVSSSSASDVSYPLINFANEWEDNMEFDTDKFGFNDNLINKIPNTQFSGDLASQSWKNLTSDPADDCVSFDLSSDRMLITCNAGTGNVNRFSLKSTVEKMVVGQKYLLKYRIETTGGANTLLYYDGLVYKGATLTAGTNYVYITCTATRELIMKAYGDAGDTIQFSFFWLYNITQMGKFLTDLPTETTKGNDTSGKIPHLTSLNDHKTFAFLNEDADFGTTDGQLEYRFFNEPPVFENVSGYEIPTNHIGKIELDNTSANGSSVPSNSSTDDQKLIFAGVGGANVDNLYYFDKGGYRMRYGQAKYYTVRYVASNTDTVYRTTLPPLGDGEYPASKVVRGDYVEIRVVGTTDFTDFGAPNNTVGTKFYSSSDSITGTGEVRIRSGRPLSDIYLFEIASDENCNSTRFDEYSLAWKNKYGTWDYYMFDGEHSDVRNYKREDQSQKVAGSWGASDFAIESYERGKVQKVGGTKQTTINTRFITDDYNDYFNGLLISNEVLLLPKIKSDYSNVYDAAIPINIKDTSLTYKTNLKDKLVQYSFTFEYAHDLKQRV